MRKLRAYLDTQVLIGQVWWSRSRSRPTGHEAARFAAAIESGAFTPIISPFCLMEVVSNLRYNEFLKMTVNAGYSPREVARQKRNYSLSASAERRIRKVVRGLEASEYLTVARLGRLTPLSYSTLRLWVSKDMDLADALHLLTAGRAECDLLVTGDQEFRRLVEKLAKEGGYHFGTRLISPSDFLQLPSILLAVASPVRPGAGPTSVQSD